MELPKKPLTMQDEPQPRNITRADLVMTEGFGLQVDGRMKTVISTLQAAQKRARSQNRVPDPPSQDVRRCGKGVTGIITN
jgi:hypothetical protein